MNIDQIKGKVFRCATGQEFGVIRQLSGHVPVEVSMQSCVAFAEDDCGNYFVQNMDFIGFWDHETGEITKLSSSANEFVAALIQPAENQLRNGQVVSAWIDPEFLAEQEKSA